MEETGWCLRQNIIHLVAGVLSFWTPMSATINGYHFCESTLCLQYAKGWNSQWESRKPWNSIQWRIQQRGHGMWMKKTCTVQCLEGDSVSIYVLNIKIPLSINFQVSRLAPWWKEKVSEATSKMPSWWNVQLKALHCAHQRAEVSEGPWPVRMDL